jgi:hypothetical protein
MREDTLKGVGDWRIELAEKHLVPFLIKITDLNGENCYEEVKQPVE